MLGGPIVWALEKEMIGMEMDGSTIRNIHRP